MSKKVVDKHNTAFKKRLTKEVKLAMKKDSRVKAMVADFKQHFKVDTYALGYEVNRQHLNPWAFCTLLELLKYRIYYDSKSTAVVFKPRSAKLRKS